LDNDTLTYIFFTHF